MLASSLPDCDELALEFPDDVRKLPKFGPDAHAASHGKRITALHRYKEVLEGKRIRHLAAMHIGITKRKLS
jgi:hypothetical protein